HAGPVGRRRFVRVHLQVAATAEVLGRWPDPWSAVSPVERDRAQAFHGADDARDFLAAHLLARECVTALTGETTVHLEQRCTECGGPHGKPFVLGLSDACVSWSHSHGHVGAVAADVPVGVDVEARHRQHDIERLVRRTATPEEGAAILAGDDPDDAYLRMWVAKEALVKVGAITLGEFGRTDVRSGTYGGFTLTVTEPEGLAVGLAVQA
ncbi:MAG TPA: 4'-phosphopantetheinyl transferase superfamily protein, partial [Mycobacteriales bacterium]